MEQLQGTALYDAPAFTTLRDVLDHAVTNWPSGEAYRWRGKRKGELDHVRTYAQLQTEIDNVSYALRRQGFLPKTMRLAVIGENSYAWVLCHNAALMGLGISIPLDRQLPDSEAYNLVLRGNANAFCFDQKHANLALMVADLPHVKLLVSLDDDIPTAKKDDPRFVTMTELITLGAELRHQGQSDFTAPLAVLPDDVAQLIYTSGTTAMSKGVLVKHGGTASNISGVLQLWHLDAGDRALSVLPLHHTFENTGGMYVLWAFGLTICFNKNLRDLKHNMVDWKINIILAVPLLAENLHRAVIKSIKSLGKEKSFKIASKLAMVLYKIGIDKRRQIFRALHAQFGGKLKMIVCGAAALDPQVSVFFQTIGINCFMGYGLTESGPVVTVSTLKDNAFGSVGVPLPNVILAVDSPSTGRGKVNTGEFLVKSPSLMIGYDNMPTETSEALTPDGWLRTGDIGYIDTDGCAYITGRAKSMIVLTNGKKVFPEELETLLERIDGVKGSFVWGAETARQTVELIAKLQIDFEQLPDGLKGETEISTYLKGKIEAINKQMPPFKAIKTYFWGESDFVRTTTLKIKRVDEKRAITAFFKKQNLTLSEVSGSKIETT